jgi:hypothetical protein
MSMPRPPAAFLVVALAVFLTGCGGLGHPRINHTTIALTTDNTGRFSVTIPITNGGQTSPPATLKLSTQYVTGANSQSMGCSDPSDFTSCPKPCWSECTFQIPSLPPFGSWQIGPMPVQLSGGNCACSVGHRLYLGRTGRDQTTV